MSKPTGGSAFPWHPQAGRGTPHGMTLRDWFAGQALTGLLSDTNVAYKNAADMAYRFADAMLAERGKTDAD